MGRMAVEERESTEAGSVATGPVEPAGSVAVGPVGVPRPRGTEGWTVEDLAAFPDDGLRYELCGGSLIVSPSPSLKHQVLSVELTVLLHRAVGPGLRVLAAPMDWRPGEDRSFQPDLLVVPRSARDKQISGPLLLVEILSPSSERVDRVLKFAAYAEAGVPQYWMVEPGDAADGGDAAVEVYDLVDGAYVLQGRATGDDTLAVEGPVPVRVVPAELVR